MRLELPPPLLIVLLLLRLLLRLSSSSVVVGSFRRLCAVVLDVGGGAAAATGAVDSIGNEDDFVGAWLLLLLPLFLGLVVAVEAGGVDAEVLAEAAGGLCIFLRGDKGNGGGGNDCCCSTEDDEDIRRCCGRCLGVS